MIRQRGFSLIEVVLAFVLLAVSLGILVAILGGGLAQVRQASDVSEATLLAQSLMDEVGVLAPVTPGRREGISGDRRYRWTLTVAEAPDPAPPPDLPLAQEAAAVPAPVLYRIEVVVGWGEGEYARQAAFATLRARTRDAGAGGVP